MDVSSGHEWRHDTFSSVVESENFEHPLSPAESPSTAPARPPFPLPAEYYSAPPGDRAPLFAPWATTGCGTVAIVLLILAFTAGYVFSHGAATRMLTWVFSKSQSDIVPMYGKDVTAGQKGELDSEMTSLKKNLAAKRISLDRLQPILRDMRDAMLDQKVTSEETNKLIVDFRAANAAAGARPPR